MIVLDVLGDNAGLGSFNDLIGNLFLCLISRKRRILIYTVSVHPPFDIDRCKFAIKSTVKIKDCDTVLFGNVIL